MIIASAELARTQLVRLREQGYAVAVATTPDPADLRSTQAAVAQALRLPVTASSNLDALEDSLRDLADIWGQPVALLWAGAERLARADGRGWWVLSEILDAADLPVIAGGEDRS